jgi:hypothetical protein
MRAKFAVVGCPGRPQLELGAVALLRQFAKTGGQDLRCCAGGGCVARSLGVERVDEPRPRDVREEGVYTDVRFERRLGEADDPEVAAPRFRLARVVEEDKSPGAQDGVVAVMGVWSVTCSP